MPITLVRFRHKSLISLCKYSAILATSIVNSSARTKDRYICHVCRRLSTCLPLNNYNTGRCLSRITGYGCRSEYSYLLFGSPRPRCYHEPGAHLRSSPTLTLPYTCYYSKQLVNYARFLVPSLTLPLLLGLFNS